MKTFMLDQSRQKIVLSETAVNYVENVRASYGLPTFDAALQKIVRDHAKQAEAQLKEAGGITMTRRKPKSEPKSSNLFLCHEHQDLEPMNFSDFKVHLVSKHDVRPDQINGTKQMMSHIDGRDYFTSIYEITLTNGLKFTQSITSERAADDMMRYA